ncbi:MAG: hypothetical protein IKE91_04520 [Clostridia bacterium]|nr:hypothetical protein [Clostridia bacterium]
MNKKEKYLFSVQKFLDLIENIEDSKLKEDIRNEFFSSIRALCDIADFDIDSIGKY